ncbi:MAG TPA: hypothetical protein H9776_09270 [Candidatus Mediterraneibacter intestinipullorum]|nr:hypothetical protein [Candidatus Mediterraneibacter intestinipullorum]
MRNKKLFAALLAGTLAVSMMGTTVFASTGTTTFNYTSGTIVGPGDDEANNWKITFPVSVTLGENNKAADESEAATKGSAMKFTLTNKDNGAASSTAVGNGLSVTASASGWTGAEIAMTGGTGVNMQLLPGDTSANTGNFLNSGQEIVKLDTTTTTDTAYASITSTSTAAADAKYSAVVTWTVTKS